MKNCMESVYHFVSTQNTEHLTLCGASETMPVFCGMGVVLCGLS